MSQSLAIIQKLAKVGKILSKIVFVCCIVGAIGCVIGIISLALVGNIKVEIGGLTIHGLIEQSGNITMGTLYAAIAIGMILCIGEMLIAGSAVKFFDLELRTGTPFDFGVADALKRLGIRTIVISLVSMIVASVAYSVTLHAMEAVGEVKFQDVNSIGMGIAFLILSVLLRHGAELRDGVNASER